MAEGGEKVPLPDIENIPIPDIDIEEIDDLDRETLKEHLTKLNIKWTNRDGTGRLRAKLRKYLTQDETEEKIDDTIVTVLQEMRRQADANERRTRELIAALRPAARTGDSGANVTAQNGQDGEVNPKSAIRVKVADPPMIEDKVNYKQFKRWLATWRNWSTLNKLSKRSRADQVATFRSYLTQDFNNRLTYAIGVPGNTELTLEEVITNISNYLKDQTNVIVSRQKFITRKQREGELFDDYLVNLLEQATYAEIKTINADDWWTTLLVCSIYIQYI